MNYRYTHTGCRFLTTVRKFSMEIVITAMVIFAILPHTVTAQNTDLPNPTANLQTAPAGTLVIAMDNTNQANPGYFNLKAYGLAVTLMNSNKNLRWIIKAGKAKDAVDFTVNAQSITTPVVVTATSRISVTNGSTAANVNSIVGTLVVGMKITAQGVAAGTTIASITNGAHIVLSAAATSTQTNKNATYAIDTYPISTYNFKSGPFIIYPADTVGVRAVINTFNNAQPAANKVNVFKTTADVTVDVRYNLTGVRPKASILNDGGSANIHVQYMLNASVPTNNYMVLYSATGLTINCFTFASEPHNSDQGAFIDSIRRFLIAGGNFLAQCHAITSYENFTGGFYQSTNGVVDNNNNISNNVAYDNPDLSVNQFEGYYNANNGGSVQTWNFAPGSVPQNNFYALVKGNTVPLSTTYGVSGAKLRAGKGGNVTFVGNHNFDGTDIEDLNGQRIYLNAFLTPAFTPSCPEDIILAVQLKYFTAKKQGSGVQMNWATITEQQSREFIIERSANGSDFSEIARVPASGNSTVERLYRTMDMHPLPGNNYYRVIQTDVQGKKTYSSIVLVDMGTAAAGMRVFPNPAKGHVNISLVHLPAGISLISVYDVTGKTMVKELPVSGNTLKLDVSKWSAGTYFIKLLTKNGEMLQQKLTVVD